MSNFPKIIKDLHKQAKKVHQSLRPYEEPYCELSQNSRSMIVKVRMPNASKRSVHLQISDKFIEVQGVSKKEKKNYYRKIDIPPLVDVKKIRAVYNNGTLKMRLPYSKFLKS